MREQLPEKILVHMKSVVRGQWSGVSLRSDPWFLVPDPYLVFTSSSVVLTCVTEALVTSTTRLFGGTRK